MQLFCQNLGVTFPPTESCVLAEFLCSIADSSPRPRSQLVSVSAALGNMYEGLGISNVMDDPDIRKLMVALNKSSTAAPRTRSLVIPIEPFHALFEKWPNNSDLGIKQLRIKVITLLAFVLMLRPSDVAPKAQCYNPILDSTEQVEFTTKQLTFNDDGSLTVVFYGIKNDYIRDGYKVHLPPSSNSKLDPISALKVYLDRTNCQRPQDGPVFLTLTKPHKGINSGTVSKILQESLDLAGLHGQFTPKCFRPSGATYAIEAKINPDSVRKQGRWKSQPVFEEHYVHAKPVKAFTDKILKTGI